MIKRLLKWVLFLVGAATGYGAFLFIEYLIELPGTVKISDSLTGVQEIALGILCAIIFGIIFSWMAPAIGKQSRKAASNIESELRGVSTNELVSGTVGLIFGFIVAYLLAKIYETFQITWLTVVMTIITYIVMGYLGIVIATKKGGEVVNTWIGNRRQQSAAGKKGKQQEAEPKILDTSVIIDGRIADIMKTGFVEGRIIIPEFVLVELRHIADSSDALKRQRGRRGLDILNKIQTEYGIEIYNTSQEKSLDEIPEVDVKLLRLAQIMNGKVITNDFNLNKVALIKGVSVLNVNELANTLKPVVLPGEEMTLFLVKEGKESNQAVSYLDDGTMIVVEDGRKHIGQTVSVMVTSVLQTSAGRMIFARIKK